MPVPLDRNRPAMFTPLAIEMIKELDLPVEGLHSKSLDQVDLAQIDLAVTVCDNAKDDCPMLPRKIETLHWPFDDPADATGSDEEIASVFRRVRNEITDRIKQYFETGN